MLGQGRPTQVRAALWGARLPLRAVGLLVGGLVIARCLLGLPVYSAPPLVAPITGSPTVDLPTSDVPASDVPASDVPASDVPTDDVPARDVPAVDAPPRESPLAEAAPSGAPAAVDTVRLRFDWGGGPARTWRGVIRIPGGTFSEPQPLGVEADQAGGVTLRAGELRLAQRSPHAYDGLLVTLNAPLATPVVVELATAEGVPARPLTTTLGELLAGAVDHPLDDQGNRLVVSRAAGDTLRVQFDREHLVFAPDETLLLNVEPHALPVDGDARLQLGAQLVEARGGSVLWKSKEHDLQASRGSYVPRNIRLEVRLPTQPGVYDLRLAVRKWGLREQFDPAKRLLGSSLAERVVQVVVVDDRLVRPTIARDAAPWKTIGELDPANPRWWQRLAQLPPPKLWSPFPKGPWHNGRVTRITHPQLGQLTRLDVDGWEAMPLPVDAIGAPHVLEVDFPVDQPQRLGISILEPNAAGELLPLGLDSGAFLPENSVRTAAWARHRLLFWPRTKSPLVVLTSRDPQRPAVFGKLRVLAGPTRLPPAGWLVAARQHDVDPRSLRMIAGYFDRPLVPQNFGGSEVRDPATGRSLHDWLTFQQAGQRLVDYLHHVGYGGTLVNVVADGSALYPSQLLDPTPRYDNGAFFGTAQDPLRKDVLELWLRQFDSAGLMLVPAVQFATPLPKLESALAAGGSALTGLELVDGSGQTWRQRHAARSPTGAYYNPLDPRVQHAMLDVIRELVNRYGRHPSFGGVAVQMPADSFATLPGVAWGLDDVTFARFEQDAGVSVAARGDERFALRAAAVAGPQREAWLRWRAEQLALFYRRMGQIVAAAGPRAKLHLAAGGLLEHPLARAQLRPSLARRNTHDDLLLTFGLDVPSLTGPAAGSILLLRPVGVMTSDDAEFAAAAAPWNVPGELDAALLGSRHRGAQLVHTPATLRLSSFDDTNPVGKTRSHTWLATHFAPTGDAHRARFARALANIDATTLFDGGWMLPLGQETVAAEFAELFSQLPTQLFTTLANVPAPLTIRTTTVADRTYLYLVNDSPWDAALSLAVDAPGPCRVTSLAPQRPVDDVAWQASQPTWAVALRPYDVVAVVFAAADVRFSQPEVVWPQSLAGTLERRLQAVSARLQQLSRPPLVDLVPNPSFDQPAKSGQIPGWTTSPRTADITLQPRGIAPRTPPLAVPARTPAATTPGAGQSVTIRSSRGAASLVSDWFAAPRTGRLALWVTLQGDDAAAQPPLRIGLETDAAGRSEYQFHSLGAAPAPAANALAPQWKTFVLLFDHLPTAAESRMRVRFDLVGPGTVHVDDLQTSPLAFTEAEQAGLTKLVTLASQQLRGGQLHDCAQTLDAYWPRFLLDHASALPDRQAQRDAAADPPAATPDPPSRMLDRLRKLRPF